MYTFLYLRVFTTLSPLVSIPAHIILSFFFFHDKNIRPSSRSHYFSTIKHHPPFFFFFRQFVIMPGIVAAVDPIANWSYSPSSLMNDLKIGRISPRNIKDIFLSLLSLTHSLTLRPLPLAICPVLCLDTHRFSPVYYFSPSPSSPLFFLIPVRADSMKKNPTTTNVSPNWWTRKL